VIEIGSMERVIGWRHQVHRWRTGATKLSNRMKEMWQQQRQQVMWIHDFVGH